MNVMNNKFVLFLVVVAVVSAVIGFIFLTTQNDKKQEGKASSISVVKENKEYELLGQTQAAPIQVRHYLYKGSDTTQGHVLNVMKTIRQEDCKLDCNVFLWESKEKFNTRAKVSEDFDHLQDFSQPLADLSYMDAFTYKGEEVMMTP